MTDPTPSQPLTPEQQDMRELRARLSRVLGVIQDPLKLATGQVGKNANYKYADLGDCLKAVRQVLSAEGLALSHPMRMQDGMMIVGSEVSYGLASEISELGMVAPTDIQKLGSYVTYLRRYSLCALLGIQGDDADPDKGPAPEHSERKEAIRERAQERAAESRASSESAPQPMTNEELRAQAELLQKWARERGVDIPARGVLSAIFAKKGWDITSRKDFQEWRRLLDDENAAPRLVTFLRQYFPPATEPEPPAAESSGAAVMKAISTWAKVQGLAHPDDEENARTAVSALLHDLKMEHATMTAKKWGVALVFLTDPKNTAHLLAVLGECFPPF